MAQDTVQMRKFVTQWVKDAGAYDNSKPEWKQDFSPAYARLGLDEYPIYDESKRKQLNDKFIRHYWMREIGCETVGHFCLWCSNTFNEIMPYYNKLYEAELLNVEHLLGIKRHKVVDMLRDFDESSSGNGSSDTSTSSTGKSTGKFSDTPQDELFVSKVDAGDYLTNLTIDDTQDNTTVGTQSKSDGTISRDESNSDTTDEFVTDPRYYQAFLDLSEKILNLDMQVIENVQVQGLFMQVWS
jgi:hypothetical protein